MPLYTRIIKTCADELLPMTHRSPGIHLSGILRAIAISQNLIPIGDETTKEGKQTRFALGNALEWAVATRYKQSKPNRYIHGLEVELDGVYINIDLIDCIDGAVEEIKLTKKSSAKLKTGSEFDPELYDGRAFCLYRWQTEAQIYALGPCFNGEYALLRNHIGFINGDWRTTIEDYCVVERKYTERELAQNWQMILNHKHLAEPEG